MLLAAGVTQFRARQYESAIETLERSLHVHPTWLGRGQNYIVLAMACRHLGRVDESRNGLAKVKESLVEMETGNSRWQYGLAASDYLVDWLTVLVLLPEAEACLQD